MIPIAFVSLWLWFLIIEKTIWLISARRNRMPLNDALEALDADKLDINSRSPRGAALSFFMKSRRATLRSDKLLWAAAVKRQLPGLNKYLTSITTLAASAPLLGLLGTVSGMVETFQVIGVYGTGNAQALASGIEEALITTQAGLLIAIPGLLAGQILRKRVRSLYQDLVAFHQAVDRWLERSEMNYNSTGR